MPNAFTWKPSTSILTASAASAGGSSASKAQETTRNHISRIKKLVRERSSFGVSASAVVKETAIESTRSNTQAYLLCNTSGSSGEPKTIRRTQRSWIESFDINVAALDLSANDVVAVFGSLDPSLTLYAILEAAHAGASILVLHGTRPDRQRAELKRLRATILYLTPAQLVLLCNGRAGIGQFDSVRHVLVGGGTLPPALLTRAKTLFPEASLTQFYGAAETSFITWSDEKTPDSSVGKSYPGVTLSVRSPDGKETSGTGEIWVQSPYLFENYATGCSEDTVWRDGFLSIGEFGRLDQDGNLFVMGRKSRMVTIADHNVFPEELETFLSALLAADHVAVVPQPDHKRGHQLVAIVAGKEHAPHADDILRSCRKELGALKSPRKIHFIDDMPLLNAGKPDYVTLRKWLEVFG